MIYHYEINASAGSCGLQSTLSETIIIFIILTIPHTWRQCGIVLMLAEHRNCMFASSTLGYEYVTGAVDYFTQALKLLQDPCHHYNIARTTLNLIRYNINNIIQNLLLLL